MKGLSAAIKVGIVVILVTVLGYTMFKSVSERASGAGGYSLWAHFRDAGGLASKSRVVVAGLTIGEITDMKLDGRVAKVTIKIRKGTEVWSNASITKKSSSLLGEFFLEIDPGSAEGFDPTTGEKAHLLKDGDEIVNQVEAATMGELMTSANKILPHIDQLVIEVRQLAVDTRELVNGRVADIAKNIDESVQEDAALVHSILARTDRIAGDIEKITGGSDKQIGRILDNVETSTRQLEDVLATTKGEIAATGADARAALAKIDGALAGLEQATGHAGSIARKIDENEGTLGRLVNDSTIADNVEGITEDAHRFTQSLFSLQTIVGLRIEQNILAARTRATLSVEIYPKPDKFYLIELVSDQRGRLNIDLYPDRMGSLVRSETVEESFRFTAMFGKKFDWLTLRIGIKESSGAIGLDLNLTDKAFVSIDAFDFLFDAQFRLRVTAAYQFFKYLYIIGGVDDVLNDPYDIPIIGDNITGYQPTEYHVGRDYFFGAMLRFNDEDLKALLYLGGSALGNIAN